MASVTYETEVRPVLVNLADSNRQELGCFIRWIGWIDDMDRLVGLIANPFNNTCYHAEIHDILFMDEEPYTLGEWKRIYDENLQLIKEAELGSYTED